MSILAQRLILSLAIPMSLAACEATPFEYRNIQYPAYGSTEWSRDLYLCKQENPQQGTTVLGQLSGAPVLNEDLTGACMRARGWRETATDAPSSRSMVN